MKKVQRTGAQRTLWFRGDIHEESMGRLFEDLNQLERQDKEALVTLYIMSGGGMYGGAFTVLHHATRMLSIPIQTIACSYVNSAAIILMFLGKTRFAIPGTTFYFHEFGRTYEKARVNVTYHQKASEELSADQELYVNLVSGHSKMKKTAVRKLMKNEVNLTASDAFDLGLIHGIWE